MNKQAYYQLIQKIIRTAEKPPNVSEEEMMELKKQYPDNDDAVYGTAWKISKSRDKKQKKD